MIEENKPEMVPQETQPEEKKPKKNSKKGLILALLCCMSVVGILAAIFVPPLLKESETESTKTDVAKKASPYRLSGNGLEDFDLVFLQIENEEKNRVYSPLSIKYTLAMLNEGTAGETHNQIKNLIGDYKPKKYNNNEHMSFANAMFIRDTIKDNVKDTYTKNLSKKYNADVVYDTFQSASTINNWVKDKTFNLIDGITDDDTVQRLDFALMNALAIDMNWNYLIQPQLGSDLPAMDYNAYYIHENFSDYVSEIYENYYPKMTFNGEDNTKSLEVAATINNYDIVKDLGEDNIRKTVGEEYDAFLAGGGCGNDPDRETFLDQYMKEIKTNYKKVDVSTDFTLADTEEVKAFAKELKEYDGVTLQYIGIMPKEKPLTEYVKELNAEKLQGVINELKEMKAENFEEGTITNLKGKIPVFNYEYELQLIEDLKKIGVTDVFDINKADLSNMISGNGMSIQEAKHKAMIEFSNEGIKAAATTFAGGAGAAGCSFDHIYDVPVKKIDISFDKPYLYIIRDKKTGEVWFAGTVYQPTKAN